MRACLGGRFICFLDIYIFLGYFFFKLVIYIYINSMHISDFELFIVSGSLIWFEFFLLLEFDWNFNRCCFTSICFDSGFKY